MKIGILTYHRTNNYGALLQAIATRVYLSRLGHEVYYIDYWPKYHQDMYSVFNTTKFRHLSFKGKIRNFLIVLRDHGGRKERIDAFKPFLEEFIYPFCKPYGDDERYDVVIYGSDQIWRKQEGLGNKLNPVYFGENNVLCDRKVSYAASMGNVNLNDSDLEMIKTNLSRFELLGVRENNIFNILNNLGLQNVRLTLDPTLLLNAQEWDRILKPRRIIQEPYAVTYQNKKAFEQTEIQKECKRRGLRLIVIRNGFVGSQKKDEFAIVSPYDFVSLIKYADFCFMASFHGLVVSINYKRQFYTSFVTGVDRGKTILKSLGLENHFVEPFGKIPSDYETIDYQKVESLLSGMRKESEDFLDSL